MSKAKFLAHKCTANRSHLYLANNGPPESFGQLILDDLFREPMQKIVSRPGDQHFMLDDLAKKFPHLKSLIFILYARHVFTSSMRQLVQEQLTIGTPANAAMLCARKLIRSLNDIWNLHLHGYSADDLEVAQELVDGIIKQTANP